MFVNRLCTLAYSGYFTYPNFVAYTATHGQQRAAHGIVQKALNLAFLLASRIKLFRGLFRISAPSKYIDKRVDRIEYGINQEYRDQIEVSFLRFQLSGSIKSSKPPALDSSSKHYHPIKHRFFPVVIKGDIKLRNNFLIKYLRFGGFEASVYEEFIIFINRLNVVDVRHALPRFTGKNSPLITASSTFLEQNIRNLVKTSKSRCSSNVLGCREFEPIEVPA